MDLIYSAFILIYIFQPILIFNLIKKFFSRYSKPNLIFTLFITLGFQASEILLLYYFLFNDMSGLHSLWDFSKKTGLSTFAYYPSLLVLLLTFVWHFVPAFLKKH